jgi:hypothetical protein
MGWNGSKHLCPSVQAPSHLAQTCSRGLCLILRGPSKSQAGRNGSTNMAASAARPIQGVGASGIWPHRPCDAAFTMGDAG